MAGAMKKAAKPRSAGWTGVYETLRHDILSLALAPGELLDEMSLSRRFGFSRSPIREALIRLSGDGLVVNLPNRTTIVAPVDIARFPQYVDALDLGHRIQCVGRRQVRQLGIAGHVTPRQSRSLRSPSRIRVLTVPRLINSRSDTCG